MQHKIRNARMINANAHFKRNNRIIVGDKDGGVGHSIIENIDGTPREEPRWNDTIQIKFEFCLNHYGNIAPAIVAESNHIVPRVQWWVAGLIDDYSIRSTRAAQNSFLAIAAAAIDWANVHRYRSSSRRNCRADRQVCSFWRDKNEIFRAISVRQCNRHAIKQVLLLFQPDRDK